MTASERGGLPLPDYDDMPVPEVGLRIRALTMHQLGQLLDYERAHANRPSVTRVMDARLAELRAGAEGSGTYRSPGI